MRLSPHELQILSLAAVSLEGRIGFGLSEEGSLQLLPAGRPDPVPAGDALPRLERLGCLKREINRSYVLTPDGWEAVEFARRAQ